MHLILPLVFLVATIGISILVIRSQAMANLRAAPWFSWRGTSLLAFILSIPVGVLSIPVLWVGAMQGWSGSQPAPFLYIGIFLFCFAWLAMIYSVVIGIIVWTRTGIPAYWTIPGGIILSAAIAAVVSFIQYLQSL